MVPCDTDSKLNTVKHILDDSQLCCIDRLKLYNDLHNANTQSLKQHSLIYFPRRITWLSYNNVALDMMRVKYKKVCKKIAFPRPIINDMYHP